MTWLKYNNAIFQIKQHAKSKISVTFFINLTVYEIFRRHKSKSKCQEEGKQLLGAAQMKDRNSSNLSVELGDNQGAMEAAQAERLWSAADA